MKNAAPNYESIAKYARATCKTTLPAKFARAVGQRTSTTATGDTTPDSQTPLTFWQRVASATNAYTPTRNGQGTEAG